MVDGLVPKRLFRLPNAHGRGISKKQLGFGEINVSKHRIVVMVRRSNFHSWRRCAPPNYQNTETVVGLPLAVKRAEGTA